MIRSVTTGEPVICDHGSLVRSCEVCERDERIKELEVEVKELTNENHKVFELVQEKISVANELRTKIGDVLEYVGKARCDIRLSGDGAWRDMVDYINSMLRR